MCSRYLSTANAGGAVGSSSVVASGSTAMASPASHGTVVATSGTVSAPVALSAALAALMLAAAASRFCKSPRAALRLLKFDSTSLSSALVSSSAAIAGTCAATASGLNESTLPIASVAWTDGSGSGSVAGGGTGSG